MFYYTTSDKSVRLRVPTESPSEGLSRLIVKAVGINETSDLYWQTMWLNFSNFGSAKCNYWTYMEEHA